MKYLVAISTQSFMQIPDIDTEILDGPDLVTLKTLEEWESIFNNNSYPYHKIISYSPIYD